jgi:RimJ/RimL family protein N-acetyltransferase
MIDSNTSRNAFGSANMNHYYSIDDLDPIVCGRSGIYLEPIAPDFATRDTIISTVPILFKTSINVQKYLPSLDFSSKESVEQFSRVTMLRTTTGFQFTYGIYLNGIIVGMIFINTPAFNKTSMGMHEWSLDFFVFAPFEGQGFMQIALPRMMMFLQKNIGVKTFYLLIDEDNKRCINLISRFPFDEMENSRFINKEELSRPPRVFECPLSTIRFS